jgi:hypothetical protein
MIENTALDARLAQTRMVMMMMMMMMMLMYKCWQTAMQPVVPA